MAKQWKCARCATKNVETTLTCSNCRMIRGAVVVKSSNDAGQSWQPLIPPSPSPPLSAAPSMEAPRPADASSDPPPSAPIPGYWVQPDQPIQGHARLRLVIPALFLVVGVVGAALAVFTASPEAPDRAANTSFRQLAFDVGDCLDIANVSEEEVSGITARPCNREHEYEVIFTGLAEGVGYPTEQTFDAFFTAHCLPAFETYIGEPYEDSVFDIFWLIPTREGWRQGDRSIQCMVYHPMVRRLTTSLKDAGRLRA